MDRKFITAQVVEEIDRLLAQGVEHAMIAVQMCVTEYVVRVIAGDVLGKGRPQPKQRYQSASFYTYRGVDAATIRMIQRMLKVKILSSCQIAREAGVSPNIVERVASGERLAISTQRPLVFEDRGEKFLPEPIRCKACGTSIEIIPCRACRTRRQRFLFL
jgi:hypothetical protein